MSDTFNVYKDGKVVQTGTSPIKITGLEPSTLYKAGTFKISRVIKKNESAKEIIPEFKTGAVVIPVDSVELSPKSGKISVGGTLQMIASISPANATNKSTTYESSAPSIISIDSNGLARAIGNSGEVNITVTTVDGKKKSVAKLYIKTADES
ncbi:Ig-like domain-containing protein [Brochothrix thermosphacta]|uniref:Ig-like domain-containing protein n=1 Tax=Brochothrix thermosphacta TaxID=2756 RepID=UPI0039B0C425